MLTTPEADALPSDRAYEKVSPAEKNGFDVSPFVGAVRASPDGDAVAYQSGAFTDPQPDSAALTGANQYLGDREGGGWGMLSVSPPLAPNTPAYPLINQSGNFGFWTPDLSAALVSSAGPELTPDAPEGYLNLYVGHSGTGGYELVTTATPSGPPSSGATHAAPFGASIDLSHVAFNVEVPLLSGDTSGGVYEWANGTLRFAGILPDGTAADDAGPTQSLDNTVSEDGSRIVFSANDTGSSQIYLREDGATTTWVSESQRTPPEQDGRATFRYATPDTSEIFFQSEDPLTDESLAADESEKLYLYDVDTGELVDLSVTADPDGARALGVAGVSADGDDAYFAARGSIAGLGTSGEPNLYHWHDDGTAGGAISLIGTLADADDDTWTPVTRNRTTRLNADGTRLAFTSTEPLTTYDNEGRRQIYIYYADSGELACASCNPAGEPPQGEAEIRIFQPSLRFDEDFKPRSFSAEGDRFFFNTSDSLVPEDGNGRIDVYVFSDPEGDGEGEVDLISTGESSADSVFMDASASGDDVFFATRERLVGIDRDDNLDLYDARVGGGIAAQNPPAPRPPCSGDNCRGDIPSPPPASSPASEAFSGPANPPANSGGVAKRCRTLDRRDAVAERKALSFRRQARRFVGRAAQAGGPRSEMLARAARRMAQSAVKARRIARAAERQLSRRDCAVAAGAAAGGASCARVVSGARRAMQRLRAHGEGRRVDSDHARRLEHRAKGQLRQARNCTGGRRR